MSYVLLPLVKEIGITKMIENYKNQLEEGVFSFEYSKMILRNIVKNIQNMQKKAI